MQSTFIPIELRAVSSQWVSMITTQQQQSSYHPCHQFIVHHQPQCDHCHLSMSQWPVKPCHSIIHQIRTEDLFHLLWFYSLHLYLYLVVVIILHLLFMIYYFILQLIFMGLHILLHLCLPTLNESTSSSPVLRIFRSKIKKQYHFSNLIQNFPNWPFQLSNSLSPTQCDATILRL